MNLPISPRERRTIAIGGAISGLALVLAFVVIPYVRRQVEREQLIDLNREKLARMEKVVGEPAKKASATSPSNEWLAARTPALAASALQSILRAYADQSAMVVSELDVTAKADTVESVVMVPATMSAIGDIKSVTSLLSYIEHGPLTLQIDELTLRPNPALKGDLLQLSATLRAPYVAKDEDTSTRLAMEGMQLDSSYVVPLFARNVFTAKSQVVAAPVAAPVATAAPAADRPVLYGTVMGNEPTALMKLDGGGTQVYRQGDVGGAYRVVKINESSVELAGPSGRVVLRLNP